MNISELFAVFLSAIPDLYIVEPTGKKLIVVEVEVDTGRISLEGSGGASYEAAAIARFIRGFESKSQAPLSEQLADAIEAGDYLP